MIDKQPSRPTLHARNHVAGLLSKQGMVVTELARALLLTAPDERLARVQEYADRFGASTGTVQIALEYLQTSGAAQLQPRGRLGTYVRELDYPLLWALASNRPIVGAMPLPYSRRFTGLATAVRAQFARQPVDLDLRFMRGAGRRLQALAARECNWALISRFAAETAAAHGFAILPVFLLGAETYMAQHVLLMRAPGAAELQDGMRVGVDPQSSDHVYMVRAASRGKRVELVEIEYSQGLRLVSSGAIDATVWSQEEIPLDLDRLAVIPLDARADPAIDKLSEAAIVIDQEGQAVEHVLRAVLDREQLIHTQREVVQLTRLPAY